MTFQMFSSAVYGTTLDWLAVLASTALPCVPLFPLRLEFVSLREAFDTSGALGRAFLGIVAVLGEMERALLIERVRSGMARARAEGRQIGRARLDVDRQQVITDRRSGMSLTQVAKKHGISRASVCRLMKEAEGNTELPAFAANPQEQASA